jgi:hypothetical protein
MFPLSADKLSFREIAKFWSREIQPHASRDELVDEMEAAWWRGELVAASEMTRLQLLRSMFAHRASTSLEGIVFVTPNDPEQPVVTELANGEVMVDTSPRVSVPSLETDQWTEESCAGAFETLSKSPSREHFPALLSLHCIELTREEFFRWVDRRGFHAPTFWKSQLRQTPKPTSKPPFREDLEAAYKQRIKEFHGKIPPTRTEDEQWGKTHFGVGVVRVRKLRNDFAPPEWRERGRRRSKGS